MNTAKTEGGLHKRETKVKSKGQIIKPGIIITEFTLEKGSPKNAQEIIARIKKGLPTATIYELSSEMDITPLRLLGILNIAQRTLDRRKKQGKLEQNESERLYRVGYLFKRAIEVLGSKEAARNWLKTPKKALGNQIPLDYADTEIGAREVDDLLGRLEYGVFS